MKLRRKFLNAIFLLGLIFIFANRVYSQSVGITGGDVTLTISTATAGQEPDPATGETTGLEYCGKGKDDTYKITVATSLSPQKFTLKVLATNIQTGTQAGSNGGTAQGELTLSTTAQDLIRGILIGTEKELHNCDIKYTASALASDGTGTDVHTITYTITLQ
jgi:hypothetical protein